MKVVLIDTSCIVSIMDRSEKNHEKCVEIINNIKLPLATCEAVIAESCYLLRIFPKAVDAILENVESGVFQLPFNLSESAPHIRKLMKQYSSVPMDFADACLVRTAELLNSGVIFTLDKDFKIYRWSGNKQFENLID